MRHFKTPLFSFSHWYEKNITCTTTEWNAALHGDSGGPLLIFEQNVFKLSAVVASLYPHIQSTENLHAPIMPYCPELKKLKGVIL